VAGSEDTFYFSPGKLSDLRSLAAQTASTDALAGYRKRLGPLTAKTFVGILGGNRDAS